VLTRWLPRRVRKIPRETSTLGQSIIFRPRLSEGHDHERHL
jgi:hypothetical protein